MPWLQRTWFYRDNSNTKESVKETLLKAAEYGEKKKFVLIGGEEALPNSDIVDAVEELNTDYKGDVHFRFGTIEEFWGRIQSLLSKR